MQSKHQTLHQSIHQTIFHSIWWPTNRYKMLYWLCVTILEIYVCVISSKTLMHFFQLVWCRKIKVKKCHGLFSSFVHSTENSTPVPVSHSCPVQPDSQVHVYEPLVFLQVPCWQGFVVWAHSSISVIWIIERFIHLFRFVNRIWCKMYNQLM